MFPNIDHHIPLYILILVLYTYTSLKKSTSEAPMLVNPSNHQHPLPNQPMVIFTQYLVALLTKGLKDSPYPSCFLACKPVSQRSSRLHVWQMRCAGEMSRMASHPILICLCLSSISSTQKKLLEPGTCTGCSAEKEEELASLSVFRESERGSTGGLARVTFID